MRSDSSPRGSHPREFPVLLFDVQVDLLVVEAGESGSDAMALSHLEVLSEVLVAAPPVGPDHAEALVAADLVEVGVAHVVLLSVHGESAVSVGSTVSLVGLAQAVAPVLDHAFLLCRKTRGQRDRDAHLLFLIMIQRRKDSYRWKIRRSQMKRMRFCCNRGSTFQKT